MLRRAFGGSANLVINRLPVVNDPLSQAVFGRSATAFQTGWQSVPWILGLRSTSPTATGSWLPGGPGGALHVADALPSYTSFLTRTTSGRHPSILPHLNVDHSFRIMNYSIGYTFCAWQQFRFDAAALECVTRGPGAYGLTRSVGRPHCNRGAFNGHLGGEQITRG